ncbi:hypothetical protein [Allosphingosinicella deserti]|uniref:Uncharacterized protein n=1 Tax=Allosphingosinicella deserti TaxID=2116704 RepID=A0A2P7QW06_9SPHN|nr:hypothetical protein [Sphingomonas deserti]PSJ42148.1 hypothetical protein C7I55_07900 [Sphingomonas deserti]
MNETISAQEAHDHLTRQVHELMVANEAVMAIFAGTLVSAGLSDFETLASLLDAASRTSGECRGKIVEGDTAPNEILAGYAQALHDAKQGNRAIFGVVDGGRSTTFEQQEESYR